MLITVRASIGPNGIGIQVNDVFRFRKILNALNHN